MPVSGLYGMVDLSASPQLTHDDLADVLLAAGAGVLQLRMKSASDAGVEAVAARLLPAVRAAGATLVVNDRLEVASRLSGVGLHLGQGDVDPRQARRCLGPGRLIGWSTHTPEQVAAAPATGVDYIGFGPVFSAAGKHLDPDDPRPPMAAVGLSGLRSAVRLSSLPVVAIGGIGLEQVEAVCATGVDAVAVISAVSAAPDPEEAARAIQRAFAARESDR